MKFYKISRPIIAKDWTAIRRSRATLIPMFAIPLLLMVIAPLLVGLSLHSTQTPNISTILDHAPASISRALAGHSPQQQLAILVDDYFFIPLFLIVPLIVSSVLAADAFAGEKERKTMESLLHLPIGESELFISKVVAAWIPSVVVSLVGFLSFAIVANASAWPIMHRVIVPTPLWLIVIFWLSPAVAALGLGVIVRISARVHTPQEANQLGGAVILPLLGMAVAQLTGSLFVTPLAAVLFGAFLWILALWLIIRGAKRFTRDKIAVQC